jgi:starvation-inducible DNA-binding protein
MPFPTLAGTATDEAVRQLTVVLADTYNLAVKTHGAHWNAHGPDFFRLHSAFEKQYQALIAAADLLAERIRALDSVAPGSMRQLLALSSIGDPPAADGQLLVEALRDDHRMLAENCRAALAAAGEAGDDVTVEMMTTRIAEHDKAAWMLTATLES